MNNLNVNLKDVSKDKDKGILKDKQSNKSPQRSIEDVKFSEFTSIDQAGESNRFRNTQSLNPQDTSRHNNSMMRSQDYSLKTDLTKKLSQFGNLKTSIQSQGNASSRPSRNGTLNTSVNSNQQTLVPILSGNRNKRATKDPADFRIPSPIRNKLDPIGKTPVERVEKLQNRLQEPEKEETVQKEVIFDRSVITSNPKVITMLDKLRQLSMLTKPKDTTPFLPPKELNVHDLKVIISVNEQIEEIRGNLKLNNDFRQAGRLSSEFQDFTVLPQWLVEMRFMDDFLTISKTSITHQSKGDVFYQGLEDFLRQQELQHVIKDISFFRNQKKWRNQTLWKNFMRKNQIQNTQQDLMDKMILFEGHLLTATHKVLEVNQRVGKMDVINFNYEQPKDVLDFEKLQLKEIEKVCEYIADKDSKVKDLCVDACRRSYKTFLRENRISVENEEEEGRGHLIGDNSNRRMEFTQLAAKSTHFKKLVKFVKLNDLLIMRCNLNLAIEVMRKVKECLTVTEEKLESCRGKKKFGRKTIMQPLFKVQVEYSEGADSIFFSPNSDSFYNALVRVLKEAHTEIGNVKMLFTDPSFADYITFDDQDSSNYEEGNILPKIMSHHEQEPIKSEIYNIVQGVQADLEAFKTENFSQWLDIIRQYSDLDISEYEQKSSDDIDKFLANMNTILDQLKNISEDQDTGLFKLKTEKLKSHISQVIQTTIKKFHILVPAMISKKSSELQRVLKDAKDNLSKPIKVVGDFCKYQEQYKALQEVWDDYYNENVNVQLIKNMAKLHGIKINDADWELSQSQTHSVEELLNKAQEFEEENRDRWRKQLEKDIPELDKSAREIQEIIENEYFDRQVADTETEQVLNEILDNEKSMSQIKQNLVEQDSYKDILDCPKPIPESIEEICNLYDAKCNLWKIKRQYEQGLINIKEKPYHELSLEGDIKDLELMISTLTKSKSHLKDDNECAERTSTQLRQYRDLIVCLSKLSTPQQDERHKQEINEIIGFDFYYQREVKSSDEMEVTQVADMHKEMTVGALIDLDLGSKVKRINDMDIKAKKEDGLQKTMDSLVTIWNKDGKIRINVDNEIERPDDLFEEIDESLARVADVQSSKQAPFFVEETEKWSNDLMQLQRFMLEMLSCQRSQKQMDNIFKAKDIKEQLKSEEEDFKSVETKYKEIIKDIKSENTGNVYKYMSSKSKTENQSTILYQNQKLAAILKEVEKQLEKKRRLFQRFFFLSSDELLDLLSSQDKIEAVKDNLKKFFDNIFDLEQNQTHITALLSEDREQLKCLKAIQYKKGGSSDNEQIDKWLNGLEREMMDTLKENMIECLRTQDEKVELEQEMERQVWIAKFNSQLIVTIGQLLWTREVEKAFERKRISEGLLEVRDVIDEYLADQRILMNSKLPGFVRKRIIAIITGEVHNKDVVDMLVENHVNNPKDFNWQKQLRYYVKVKEIEIWQVNSNIDQGQEQLGSLGRLVITPLTERCWNTITGALALRLGAAPAGPAGTGKTESTKDLSKGLAIYCIVFNCGPTVETKMIITLCCGLTNQGSWACLDEFNRIRLDVLSVIAEMMTEIKDKRLKHTNENKFDETFQGIKVNQRQSMGVQITMNPGQAGRNELPDNLQVSFRPVAMMVPNQRYIAEIMIQANGFSNAREKANKMAKLLILSSEQLSQQPHYDFGMRALKSILVKSGDLKKNFSDMDEKELLIGAMRSANLPKFVKEDKELFERIVTDLYPDFILKELELPWLSEIAKQIAAADNKQITPMFLEKFFQFFDTTNLRFGTMMVGPPNGGKTYIYNLLGKVINCIMHLTGRGEGDPQQHIDTTEIDMDIFNNFQVKNLLNVHHITINPKSITKEELQGLQDNITGDWREGLASNIMKGQVRQGHENYKWIIFDGPIDAVWIEDMNSVLDDSMLLCLGNGERIKLNLSIRILFECEDLMHASLATVSRTGIIQVPEETVGWKTYIDSFLKSSIDTFNKDIRVFEEQHIKYLIDLFKSFYPNLIQWQRTKIVGVDNAEPIPTSEMQQIQVAGNLIHSLLKVYEAHILDQVEKEKIVEPRVISDESQQESIEKLFLFATIWTFGGTFDESKKVDFQDILKQNFKKQMSTVPGQWNDFYPHFEDNEVRQRKWEEIVPRFKQDSALSYFDLVVPTKDTLSFSQLMDWQVKAMHPVFFTGVTGAGKTIACQKLMEKLSGPSDKFQAVSLYFSAQTNSQVTQKQIEDKFKGVGMRNVIGPSAGFNHGILMIDDVNMPQPEEFEAQPPVELMRQFIGFNEVYDRNTKEVKQVKNIVTVCVASPPTGSRAKLSKRFSKFFHILNIPRSNTETLSKIFNSILGGWIVKTLAADYHELGAKIVNCCIKIQEESCRRLKPTPIKSHQYFNLRDVSKMIQGIMMTRKNSFPKKEVMNKLIAHESSRVFRDRLIDEADLHVYDELLLKILKTELNIGSEEQKQIFSESGVVFCNFNKSEYLQNIPDTLDIIKAKCIFFLKDQNMHMPDKMNLVFFTDATKHICRISRLLKQARGNGLLVGISGSGRQSLSKLSTRILEQRLKPMVITKNFKMDDFRKLLIELMKMTGAERDATTFLMNDSEIKFEAQVECINNLLNTGEVPNLFESDPTNQKEAIMQIVRENANNENYMGDKWQQFVNSVRDNLHIVMTMNPIGDEFRTRIRNFPSIVNCSAIDWFHPWPEDALIEVAENKFQGFTMDVGTKEMEEEFLKKLIKICPFVHQTVKKMCTKFEKATKRVVHVTPKNYLDLIEIFKHFFNIVKTQFDFNIRKYKAGVQIMNETASKAKELVESVKRLKPEVEEKKKNAEIKSKKAEEEERKAAIVLESQSKVKEEVELKKNEAYEYLQKCDKELKEAEKFKQSATHSVEKLKEEAIREVSGQRQEHILKMAGVDKVLQAVMLIITGRPNLSELRPTLSKPKNLKGFDLNLIENEFEKYKKICSTFRQWQENEKDVINHETMQGKSTAIYSLQDWTVNILKYQAKIEVVVPMKQNARIAKETSEKMQQKLDEEMKKQHELMDKVELLREERDEALKQAADLEDLLRRQNLQLNNSGSLTESLEEEFKRWNENVEYLTNLISKLVGDVFLSSSAMSYQGPFLGKQRDELVDQWAVKLMTINMPKSDVFKMEEVLSDNFEIRNWRIYSLPSDKVSTCNAIMASKSLRVPIIIDPQELAYKWLNNMGSKSKKEGESSQFKAVKSGEKQSIKTIEKGIESGWSILQQDCSEKLDNNIDSLLQTISNAIGMDLTSAEIRFNDRDIVMHPDFKLYLCTKISNPNQLPETFIKSNVINFLVTSDGLEEDLLTKTVGILRPEDEDLRSSLIEKIAKNDNELNATESNILETLLETQTKNDYNVLEDNGLIDMLKDSKSKSFEIKNSKEEAEATNQKLMQERQKQISVAVRGSILYFILTDLALINQMQQFSLEKVNAMFSQVIEKEKQQSTNLEEQFIPFLVDTVTKYIFNQCSRAIFEEHKLIFSFFIASRIGLKEKVILPEEYMFLLTGTKPGFDNERENPLSWLDSKNWNQLCMLEDLSDGYFNLTGEILKNQATFKEFIYKDNIQDETIPGVFEQLDSFKKALLIRCVRPEKIMFMMKKQVSEKIGEDYASPSPQVLSEVMEDTDERSPVIFILAKGADPSDTIKEMAKQTQEKERERTIREISLGSGSEDKAVHSITTGAAVGHWVILCNCHLFESWLPNLLQQTDKLKDQNMKVQKDFRLFLTSANCEAFPVPILQGGIKIAYEPPKGIKKNMLSSLMRIDESSLDDKLKNKTNLLAYKRLVFGAIFLHSVILERKKFGPLGFNKSYDFNESDLAASLDTLTDLCSKDSIPYDAVEQMIGEITQGGRVTEEQDFPVLECTLRMFINEKVNQTQDQKFSKSGIYQLPKTRDMNNFDTWIEQIRQLPEQDPPEIFGMHSNADITQQQNMSQKQLQAIMVTVADEGGAGEEDGNAVEKTILDMIKKFLDDLPEPLRRNEASKAVKERGDDGSISIYTVFLFHEMEKFTKLLIKMRETLTTLQDAIKGIALMSAELDKMYSCFLINVVPPNWMKLSFLSLKPLGSWMADLISRIVQLRKWLTSEVPSNHRLTVQYFPQGFLTAVLQAHSRLFKIEIDTLDFLFDTLPESDVNMVTEPPKHGIYIQGLFCDGFGYNFEKNRMSDQAPGVTQCQAPIFNFIPTRNPQRKGEHYKCPIYKTILRTGTLSTTGASTNFIRNIDLQQNMDSTDQWVKKGAALLCNLND